MSLIYTNSLTVSVLELVNMLAHKDFKSACQRRAEYKQFVVLCRLCAYEQRGIVKRAK